MMDMGLYTRFVLSLGFVIGLIWLLAYAMKRSGLDKRLRGVTGGVGRMQITDVLYIDPKRKLVLLRVDKKEYCLLVAGDTVTVVDRLGEKHDHA